MMPISAGVANPELFLSAAVQDLELWISKEAVEGGYNLVARAGRTVQEVLVSTALPLDEMKAAMQRVLRRLI